MVRRFVNASVLFIFVVGLLAILPVQPVYASTLTVNTLVDEQDGSCTDGDCSLRDAIDLANSSGDTISFSVNGTITLTSQLLIGKDVTIAGPGPGLLTVSGDNLFRVFFINNSSVTVTISGLTVSHGKVTDDDGGGIRNHGTLTLDNVIVDHNSAANNTFTFDDGGGIYNTKTLVITNSQITNNEANFTGGGIGDSNGSLDLTNVTISGNKAVGNVAGGSGGGIAAINSTSVTMDSVSVISNTAKNGGAMYINNVPTLNITNSLIASNFAEDTAGGAWFSATSGTYDVRNSTFSGNQQTVFASGFAGGLWADGAITVNLFHVTVTQNTVEGTGGGAGIYAAGSPTINIKNSIVAGNTASNSTDEDCNGAINSQDYNLIQDADGNCTITGLTGNNITGQSPLLNALADNGGLTKTHSLQANSPALDAIPNATAGCGSTFTRDQRGLTRPSPVGGSCDIGAFEFHPTVSSALRSQGVNDGWILESTETSNKGGTLNTSATLLFVGDNAQDKQYKSFLSFNTAGLPDNAVITSVKLKIKVQGFVGGNMFTPTKILGNLLMDIRKPYFGTSVSLVITDFQSAAGKNSVGALASVLSAGLYTVTLKNTAYDYVNLTGTTQFRLRFTKDDNDDSDNDYLKIYSGDAPAASRPQLIVEYHLP